MTLRIAWFSTGRGPGSRNLLNAVMQEVKAGTLDAELTCVFSNREPGEHEGSDRFFELVRSYGLELLTLSSAAFRRRVEGETSIPGEPLPAWRRAYDARVVQLLAPYRFDYGILAGYMLICTEELCERWPLLNLHPAAPSGPAGTWQEVIRTLIAGRVDHSGVMVHLATRELDRGPAVTYCTFSLHGYPLDALWAQEQADPSPLETPETSPLFREIRRHGAARELPLVVETLRALAAGRIAVCEGRVVDAAGRPTAPLDLTAQVDRAVLPMLSDELSGL